MLRTTPVFADPKSDFVFQRIFGSEEWDAYIAASMAIQNERGRWRSRGGWAATREGASSGPLM